MDPVQIFREATRLQFDLRFVFEIELPALGISLGPSTRVRNGICIMKPVGELEFTLNTAYMSIPELKTNFDITFKGTETGPFTVLWKPEIANLPLNVKTTTGDVTITDISGQFSTANIPNDPPWSDTSCGGERQAQTVMILQLAGVNELELSTAAAFAVRIKMSDFSVDGSAGVPADVAVVIRQLPTSECVSAAIEGQVATFDALVSGAPAPASFRWSLTGGAPAGLLNGQQVKVLMPYGGTPVKLRVTVTIGTQPPFTVAKELDATVITEELAQRLELLCKIFMKERFSGFIDPLWDPLRDLVVRPIDQPRALELQQFARALTRLSDELAKGVGKASQGAKE